MNREPVLIIGGLTSIFVALLDVAILFGLDWTDEQKAGVIAVVTSVGSLAGLLLARSRVTPTAMEK